MMRILGSHRVLGAVALLAAFNVLAIWVVIASGVPAEPWVFAAWFVGDAFLGLVALGLTDRE